MPPPTSVPRAQRTPAAIWRRSGNIPLPSTALQAYLLQRVAPQGFVLDSAHLLYLATRAGAEALGLSEEIGDFQPGKAADFVYLWPVSGSPLAEIVEQTQNPERVLSALFTLAGQETVREVRVAGTVVYKVATAVSL